MTEQVIAYQRKAIRDGSTLDVVPLILPEVTFDTEAVWFCPDGGCSRGSRRCRSCSAPSTPPSTR